MMRRRATRVREGQAWERKEEGKCAHVEKTRFRRTGLVKSEKAMGRSSYTRETLKILWKLRVSQDKSS